MNLKPWARTPTYTGTLAQTIVQTRNHVMKGNTVQQLSPTAIQALKYVRNTGGCATKDNFIEDHEPIGHMLWTELHGLIDINDGGKIQLSPAGEKALTATAA